MEEAVRPSPTIEDLEIAIREAEEGNYTSSAPVLSAAISGAVRAHSYHELAAAHSYYGLCVAQLHHDYKRAAEYCERAVQLEPDVGRHHVNLAKVFVAAGNRRKAMVALERGLKRLPDDPSLMEFLRAFGYRHPTVLSFLPRRHPVNRLLGRLRHMMVSRGA